MEIQHIYVCVWERERERERVTEHTEESATTEGILVTNATLLWMGIQG